MRNRVVILLVAITLIAVLVACSASSLLARKPEATATPTKTPKPTHTPKPTKTPKP